MPRLLGAVLLGIAVLGAGSPHPALARQRAHPQDWQFMRRAAALGRAEVAAGTLAAASAADPAVRDFGKRLAQDFDSADRHLDLLALDTQIPLPVRPSAADQGKLERLRALHGAAFDHAFLAGFGVAAHQNAIASFEQELGTKNNEAVLVHYAKEHLPMLRQHLQTSQDLLKHVPATSAGAGRDDS